VVIKPSAPGGVRFLHQRRQRLSVAASSVRRSRPRAMSTWAPSTASSCLVLRGPCRAIDPRPQQPVLCLRAIRDTIVNVGGGRWRTSSSASSAAAAARPPCSPSITGPWRGRSGPNLSVGWLKPVRVGAA